MPEHSRGTVVVWAIAAVVAALALLRLLDSRDDPPAASVKLDRPNVSGSSAGGRGSTAYVHVAGAVRRPGLLRVAAGSRVAAAIERAGGPTRKAALSAVNLAARVEDGQQIVVPGVTAGPGSEPGVAGEAAAASAGVKPSLGSATTEQLDEVEGIGPTLAERIVEYRQAHGGFGSIDELADVEGIGEKRLQTLREALSP
jgi:competence protein ComEA